MSGPERALIGRTSTMSSMGVLAACAVAGAALGYGCGICDKVSAGHAYAQVVGEVKADIATSDEYQASYLINQAVNELCPAQIWQLRNSAAHYRPPPVG
jgi:hypothetical protein